MVIFIVVAKEVIQCFIPRFCDGFNAVELTRMWELGLIELMFEGLGIKIYRRVRDKFKGLREDRLDKEINWKE